MLLSQSFLVFVLIVFYHVSFGAVSGTVASQREGSILGRSLSGWSLDVLLCPCGFVRVPASSHRPEMYLWLG